jgi:hypothetical protein
VLGSVIPDPTATPPEIDSCSRTAAGDFRSTIDLESLVEELAEKIDNPDTYLPVQAWRCDKDDHASKIV